MADFKEQRMCIKFCFKLKKTAAETHRMLKEAFGDNAMSQSKTFLWYKRFKDGRTSVDDDERSGRPSTSTTSENIAKVREAILADRRRTIHDVCEIVGEHSAQTSRQVEEQLVSPP
jgi:histone-lysine N-methyltransferase SETMAR